MKRKLIVSMALLSALYGGMMSSNGVGSMSKYLFNAFDEVSVGMKFPPVDFNIKTKIVGKKFTLYFLPYGKIKAQYRLYDMDRETNLTDWKEMNNWMSMGSGGYFSDDFIVNRAAKRVKVQFRFCQSKDAPGIPVDLQNCNGGYGGVGGEAQISTAGGNAKVQGEVSSNGVKGDFTAQGDTGGVESSGSVSTEYEYNISVFSSDDFAIRPANFKFVSIPQKVKAGEEFNITIEAVDVNGNPVKDYNETLNNSPELTYQLTKSDCNLGKLEIVDGGNFKDGVAQVKLKYNEVGELNLTLQEIEGSEFALVDKDDTPLSERMISEDINLTESIPYKFDISADLQNYKNRNFTYISSDLDNMASKLNINITAKNKDGITTKNYNNKCYAKDIQANLTDYVTGDIDTFFKYKVNNNSENKIKFSKNLTLTIPKSSFTTDKNGSADINISFNFEKNYSKPVKEFDLVIDSIEVKDENNISSVVNINKNSTFRYGRIEAQNVCSTGTDLNTSVIYEYWTDSGWKINKDHTIEFNGVDKDNSYKPSDIELSVNNTINNGLQTISIETNHSLPYFAKIHLAIPSYLWYHPLAKQYEVPSSTNLDCLTHPCLSVGFNQSSKGWGGIGKDRNPNGSLYKYSASKRAADISSSDKVKANKLEIRKLNW